MMTNRCALFMVDSQNNNKRQGDGSDEFFTSYSVEGIGSSSRHG
jgi:hypothetical protein